MQHATLGDAMADFGCPGCGGCCGDLGAEFLPTDWQHSPYFSTMAPDAMDYDPAFGGFFQDIGKAVTRMLTPSERQLQLVQAAAPIVGDLASAGVFAPRDAKGNPIYPPSPASASRYQPSDYISGGAQTPEYAQGGGDNTTTVLLIAGGVLAAGVAMILLTSPKKSSRR